MKIFTYLSQIQTMKDGVQDPEGFASDFSFAFVERYFILLFLALGFVTLAAFGFGIYFDIVFLQIVGVLFLLAFIALVIIYRVVKKTFENAVRKMGGSVRAQFRSTKRTNKKSTYKSNTGQDTKRSKQASSQATVIDIDTIEK